MPFFFVLLVDGGFCGLCGFSGILIRWGDNVGIDWGFRWRWSCFVFRGGALVREWEVPRMPEYSGIV